MIVFFDVHANQHQYISTCGNFSLEQLTGLILGAEQWRSA
jgi:hypothetical protein